VLSRAAQGWSGLGKAMLDNAGLLLGELVRYNGVKEILHQNVEEEEDERADRH
jgi:hypothetical protein